jgi:hypothetical protein
VLAKECLCTGLSNAAVNKYSLTPLTKKSVAVNICPGPNIAYFNKIASLQEMIDHIYGRTNIIPRDDRPHMFIKELMLYVDYWTELLTDTTNELDQKRKKYVQEFHKNLMDGISYYRNLAEKLNNECTSLKDKLHDGLSSAEKQLGESINKFAERLLVSA